MKKLNLAIAAMALLLVFLSAQAGGVGVDAAVTCQDLTGCCGAAGCSGPGQVTGCSINCAGGGAITCPEVKNGKCGGEELPD